ncbi:DegT/DnrJ/EryC1/StrS family aminotransferase [Cryobacterium sp. SO2]|uniref:DegT/DnrJ/EryC1/StrS family aminotransferase n=1 Tax=Cryobacterium sp. SO2 TaxID=1897060 RepID=UPI00223CC77F|nr:DegT/DnrJ/EryC1/StrS family aminotransferase [Cryobacterium sp. SO2]WEO77309.1 DegT/DnrJ/EryC1/StrS family aminotransferase [Cryobacterium sp. SO2]
MTDTITPMTNNAVERWIPCEEDGSGHSFGDEELALVTEVLRSGVLISSDAGFTRRFELEIADRYGVGDAIACSSGTTALQGALAVLGLEAGSEVVTTPLSDIGGVSPILQEGLVPVFADVDPVTGNIDPESVERAISPRTSAILITHLVGKPCDMTRLMQIAEKHGLAVVEDCAQAYDARHAGRFVGTFGAIGTFSTQQTKHISAGEGGLAITDDPELARRLRSWVNKGVAARTRSRSADHPILGMNARMSEVQAAIAVAQLGKLDASIEIRISHADLLSEQLAGVEGVICPSNSAGEVQTYWKYLLSVDPEVLPGVRDPMADEFSRRRAVVVPCYLHLPLFEKTLFQRYPRRLVGQDAIGYADKARDDTVHFPGMNGFIERAIVVWWNERITVSDVDRIAELVRLTVVR